LTQKLDLYRLVKALVLIAAVSGVIPARQASKVDPIVTLRAE